MGKYSIGQAGIRLMGAYSSTTDYMVAHAVKDTYGNWWYSKKGTAESPNKGNALPTIKNGVAGETDWWRLMINVQDCVEATSAAKTATTNANTATSNANTAASNANTKANLADEVAKNPPKIGDDGFWYYYNPTTKKYEKTNYVAKGGVEFPTFSVDTDTMQVQVETENDAANKFAVDNSTGQLTIVL